MRLDTVSKMKDAQKMYEKYGFYRIDQYIENTIEGSVFMEKGLEKSET